MTNLIPNGDFQLGWQTNPATGDQTPNGWELIILPNGAQQLWPTKGAWGPERRRVVVPATVERQPECVFKLSGQLPPNERFEGPDSLLFGSGWQVYKTFHGPSSRVLSRRVTGLRPSAPVRFAGWMLAKSEDVARGPDGLLEADHCRVRMFCGEKAVERTWAEMKERHDYVRSSLAWNVFEMNAATDAKGEILVGDACQQNWSDDPTGVAFFQGPMTMEYVDGMPAPVPDPTPTPLPQPGTLSAFVAAQEQMVANLKTMHDGIHLAETHAADVLEMARKMLEATK